MNPNAPDSELPLVSVVVPVFNTPEQYLRECVESILSQTWKNTEVLLVDNGSDEPTAALCRRYSGSFPRVRYLREPKRGVSAARNLGIDASEGEFICFVDSDDTVAPDYLECMLEPMLAGRSEVGACLVWNERSGAARECRRPDAPLSLSKTNALLRLSATANDKMYRKSALRDWKIRFDERYRMAEDQIFATAYLVRVSGAELCRSGNKYYYRNNPESKTKTCAKDKFEGDLLDWTKALERRILPMIANEALKLRIRRRADLFRATDTALRELKRLGKDRTRLFRILAAKRRASIPATIIVGLKHPIGWLKRMIRS